MNKLLRAGLVVALCAAAAACADKKPAPVVEAPPPPPPPPAPAVVTAFDGVYRGQYVRTPESPKKGCVASHHGTIRVTGGTFSAMVSKAESFQGVQVGPDGAFTGTSGDETLKGMIADGKLSGTLDGATCHYTVSMIARAAKAR